MFVTKLTAAGIFDWIRITECDSLYSSVIALDSASNILIAAQAAALNISGTLLTGGLVVKLNPAGTSFAWERKFMGNVYGYPASVAVSLDDNVFTTSTLSGSAFLENLFVFGSADSVMLKLSPAGSLGWINRGGSIGDINLGLTVSVDRKGNPYYGGTYDYYDRSMHPTAGADFGHFLTPPGRGGYLAKYSPDGDVQWLQTLHGPGTPISISGSTILPNGNVMILGLFKGSAAIGETSLNGSDSYTSPFIAELDSASGSVLASQVLNIRVADDVAEAQYPFLIASAPDGSVRIAGYFTGTFTFGSTTVKAVGNSDVFVAALSSIGAPLWVKTAGSPLDDTITALAYDGLGHTYVCGSISGDAKFDQQTVSNKFSTTTLTFLARIDEGNLALPKITNAPIPQLSYAGGNVTFAVGVNSPSPARYQWFFNNVAIAGQTNSTLSLGSVNESNAGTYFVEVANAEGFSRSNPVDLVIRGSAPILLTTIAGTNIAGYNDASVGSAARFDEPNSPAITFDGNAIVPEIDNIIRIVEPNGTVSIFAGNTNGGFANGPASIALFSYPLAVTIDHGGDIFVADTGNNMIRRISSFGAHSVTTYAGSGVAGYTDGPSSSAQFSFPNDLVFDSRGNLFVTEFINHTVRKISSRGTISTFAGNGHPGYSDGVGTNALLNMPAGITIDANDNLYITEWSGQRIRKITPSAMVTTLAGTNVAGFLDGPGSSALLSNPDGITIDPSGNLYFTEYANHSVRKLDRDGIVTTLVGLGVPGFRDGDQSTALLRSPGGIAWYPDGSLIIADTANHAIRKLKFVTNPDPSQPTLIVNLHPGLTIFGAVGKTYRIETAESSMGPLNWTVIGTITLTQPVDLFFDSEPATRAQRLYRATQLP
jgi:sugar lactone lactonase YvrE